MKENQALDEYSLFENGIEESNYPVYEIGRDLRRNIFITIFMLVLSILRYSVGSLLPNSFSLTIGQDQFFLVCSVIAEVYWCYFMLNYFKHYNLKWIVYFTWIMLVIGISLGIIDFLSTLYVFIPDTIAYRLGVLYLAGSFIWIIMVLGLNERSYMAIQLFKYASIVSIWGMVFDLLFYSETIWFLIDPKYDKYLGMVSPNSILLFL